MLAIKTLKCLGNFRLQCTFSDGNVKVIDFAQHWDALWGPVFQPLRDPMFFARVTLPPDSETIEWPNGADLAAEFLYEIGETVHLPSSLQPAMVAAG